MNLKKQAKKSVKTAGKILGFFLIIIGIFIIIIQPFSTTGAVIDLSTSISRIWFFIGLGMIVISIIIITATATKESRLVRITQEHHESHNATNARRLKQEYEFEEAHGTPSTDPKAWVKMYHGYVGKKPDFSKGIDKTKSEDGFFFTPSIKETYDALQSMGFHEQDINIIPIKISKNVYSPMNKKSIVQEASSPGGEDYFKIPVNKYKKANKLISKGLIKIG